MNTHSIELDGYYARSRGNSTIYLGTAGSHGNEQLQVTQGKGWEGLTVQVVFHPCKVAVQLPANGVLDVPWEATARSLTAMQGRIVFQGFDQDRLVNSTDLAYSVASHSPALGRDEQPYTPGIVEGVLNQMAADKDAILQATQQTGQAKEAAAASAAEAASSAANAQQSAGAANTSASQAAGSASQAAGSAAAANETLTQVQTAGQEAQQKVKDAETEALGNISAAAPALPAVSTDAAWQSVTVKPDGSGYNLAAMAPIEATIRPTVTGNPAVCEDSVAWGLQGLKIYGKSTQDGTPSPENPVPIASAGEGGSVELNIFGKNLCPYGTKTFTGYLIEPFGYFLPAGTYTLSVTANSEDQEYNLCLVYFFNTQTGKGVANKTINRDTRVSVKFLVPQKFDAIYLYSSIGASQSQGKRATFSDIQLEVGSVATPYEPYTGQSLPLSTPNGLPGIPVSSGGNYTDSVGQQLASDYWDFGDGQQHILCDEIASYNGEEITTPYISSTGALTTGAQVLYVLPKPRTEPIPAETMAAYRALTTYSGTTVVSTADPVAGIEARYIMDGNKYRESVDKRLAALEAAQTGI